MELLDGTTAGRLLAGIGSWPLLSFPRVSRWAATDDDGDSTIRNLLREHLKPLRFDELTISERRFPFRMRADLQRTLDSLFAGEIEVLRFTGVRREYAFEGLTLTDCLIESEGNSAVTVPPEFEELDIGEPEPFPVLKNGLWLAEHESIRFAVTLSPCASCGQTTGMQIQVRVPNSTDGGKLSQSLFAQLERAVAEARSYRGKILSLEQAEHSYTGESAGITVHQLRVVQRDQVILPESTLALLERNVINFVKARTALTGAGLSTKKGILFYGPPGTGKTHTIHYLARALEGHTTLLISAEQLGLLGEYMTLARLLQPSIVVMEDVDLIARERTRMNSPCEEVMLNKLLNEMDGLKESADILFILTTNRPETLESALASRPGRIDQAIEFPRPNESGRRKLVNLYAGNSELDDGLIEDIVDRTAGVSAAFIKELMRRVAQFSLERGAGVNIQSSDVSDALEEMLFRGGALNRSLLGGEALASEETGD